MNGMSLGMYLILDKKNICLEEIGVRAHNMILNSPMTMIGGGGRPYNHLMNTKIFTSITSTIFIRTPKTTRQMATGTTRSCSSSRTNCVFYILQVGAVRKISTQHT